MVKPAALVLVAAIGLGVLVGGCASDQEAGSPTLPSDGPTLLYFYTDG